MMLSAIKYYLANAEQNSWEVPSLNSLLLAQNHENSRFSSISGNQQKWIVLPFFATVGIFQALLFFSDEIWTIQCSTRRCWVFLIVFSNIRSGLGAVLLEITQFCWVWTWRVRFVHWEMSLETETSSFFRFKHLMSIGIFGVIKQIWIWYSVTHCVSGLSTVLLRVCLMRLNMTHDSV